MLRHWIIVGLCLWVGLSACRKKQLQHEADVSAIQAYVDANNLPASRDQNADYFYYFTVRTNQPKLVQANAGLTLKIRYRAELLDGTEVANTNTGFDLVSLDDSLFGWRLALPRMRLGERMILILPSRLAYGDESSSTIPPNSNLVFDIELLDVFPQL